MSHAISILGIGTALPSNEVTSAQLDDVLKLEQGRIEKTTGLVKRHFYQGHNPNELALKAVQKALQNAQMSIDEIDCIIQSGATMEQAIPYNAAGLHRLLNLKRPIASFDVNMTCLSVLRAFELASHLFESYRTILIVSCDVHSVGLDWSDIRTAGIFGDGASALIVSQSKSGGILVSNFETHSSGYDYCQVRGCGVKVHPNRFEGEYKTTSNFEMNGKGLFKLVSHVLPEFIERTLASAQLHLSDIDWVVPHQASQSSLDHMVKLLGIEKAKLIDIFKTHGNQVASSIPFALEALMQKNDFQSGQKVMMVGTSAGVGLGLVVWEVP